MCGILGAYDLLKQRTFPKEVLQKMATALQHRGPEKEDFYSKPGYATGVRRLILRDREGGNQPMQTNSSCFSYNGELYSFKEDRLRLSKSHIHFHTFSDTEVFQKGLEVEGLKFIQNAEAQFAFAFYDKTCRSLLLARDRFGIVPLYYTYHNNWLLYASEIKALLASGEINPKPAALALDHILSGLALSPGESCFENIFSIPPGFYLHIDGKDRKLEKYVASSEDEFILHKEPEKKLIDKLDALLLSSVARRLEADADIGVYLSGGVDSSLIAAMAKEVTISEKRKDLSAYSIRLGKDESSFAIETAKKLGIRHIVLDVQEKDIISAFPAAVYAAEMPVLDHANICLQLLAKEVKKDGRKGVLTGEGADEAFGGYPWHRFMNPFIRTIIYKGMEMYFSNKNIQKTAVFRSFNQYPLFLFLSHIRDLFYSKEFKDKVYSSNNISYPLTKNYQVKRSKLQNSLHLDYEWLLAGHLLIDKGDRVSMSASIEARYPFLDTQVFQFANQIPDVYKFRGLTNKWILRKVAERYLSKETAQRKKHMFRAEPLIHGKARPNWVEELLSPESLRFTGFFEPALVEKHLYSRNHSGYFSNPLLQVGLSGVVSTQLWYHLFCGGNLCSLPPSI